VCICSAKRIQAKKEARKGSPSGTAAIEEGEINRTA